mmetsp:Transcript_17451/g.60953  ORF Transcript_17451/g.60953 Transcript_17451/m.60953 type:complete len:241 (+) Transcript_17451:123-845(+)
MDVGTGAREGTTPRPVLRGDEHAEGKLNAAMALLNMTSKSESCEPARRESRLGGMSSVRICGRPAMPELPGSGASKYWTHTPFAVEPPPKAAEAEARTTPQVPLQRPLQPAASKPKPPELPPFTMPLAEDPPTPGPIMASTSGSRPSGVVTWPTMAGPLPVVEWMLTTVPNGGVSPSASRCKPGGSATPFSRTTIRSRSHQFRTGRSQRIDRALSNNCGWLRTSGGGCLPTRYMHTLSEK